jgi:hypothetical protein
VNAEYQSRTSPLVSLIVFLILSAVAGGAGHFYFVHLRNQIIEEKKNELHAISELKVRQLAAWRGERFSGASFIFNSRTIADEVAMICKYPTQTRNRKQTLG